MFSAIGNFFTDVAAGLRQVKTDLADGYAIGEKVADLGVDFNTESKSLAFRIGYKLGFNVTKDPKGWKWLGYFTVGSVLLCTMRVICPVLFIGMGLIPHLMLIGYVCFGILCMYKVTH